MDLLQSANDAEIQRMEQEAVQFVRETTKLILMKTPSRLTDTLQFAEEIHEHAQEHGLTYGELALAAWFLIMSTMDARDEFEFQPESDNENQSQENQDKQTDQTGCTGSDYTG